MNIIPQCDMSAKAAHFFDHLNYFKTIYSLLGNPQTIVKATKPFLRHQVVDLSRMIQLSFLLFALLLELNFSSSKGICNLFFHIRENTTYLTSYLLYLSFDLY